MATILTDEALAGFQAPTAAAPHIWSSAAWFGFRAGQALAIAGAEGVPIKANMSRGYSVRVTNAQTQWLVTFDGADLLPRVRLA